MDAAAYNRFVIEREDRQATEVLILRLLVAEMVARSMLAPLNTMRGRPRTGRPETAARPAGGVEAHDDSARGLPGAEGRRCSLRRSGRHERLTGD